jgi:oligoribonuclease NrnB/cAMP/cGMP phosphodiesterase (DHH superfamily)
MSHLVIYHANCMDGSVAAWAAARAYPGASLLGAKHGDEAPGVDGLDVTIVDFSYPRQALLAMKEQARTLQVLDHHKTAQADLEGLDFCTFDMNRSGAGLAWDELHTAPRPRLIGYVEDRDLWRFALPESKAINALIGSFELYPGACDHLAWKLDDAFEECVEIGNALLRGVNKYVAAMAEHAREVTLAGYKVLCVNAPYLNTSELVGHLAERNFGSFAAGWFQRADGMFQYSLRSRDAFDVSEVAKQFGGGGHRNAAGFATVERVDL